MPKVLPAAQGGIGTLLALIFFILASMWIATLANRAMQKGSFLKGFFLGNRGLGSWALALTATVQSGGTFMGFPSLVYTHGWIVALWIGSYMVVPLTGFAILGKRMAQISRRTGAITVPDLFRERFGSPALGLVASLLIMFYMSFMMVAQFKAGAIVMKLSWPGSGALALSEDLSEYKLTEASLQTLSQAKVPPAVIEELKPLLDKGFDTERELNAALQSVLNPDEIKQYKPGIIESSKQADWLYFFGLAVFTLTVVGYTLMGGFLAAVWTDLFQSVMMLIGVVILLVLALSYAGGLEQATRAAIEHTGPGYASGPGYDPRHEGREFLPLGLAFSFFFVWVFSGLGSPAGIVRIMASKSTGTIRRAIYLLSFYNAFIYIPLIMICICGRALIPDLPPGKTDEIVPQLALSTTAALPGGSFIAGLILAAPFGAVMATVSSYLVVIASGLVRDVYQRFINPAAGESELKRLSTIVMISIGAIAVLANIKPVAYLQAIVVFSGTGAAATFCVGAVMVAFWRRASVPGVLASMISGAATMMTLYGIGFAGPDAERRVDRIMAGILPSAWTDFLGLGHERLIGPVTKFHPYFLCNLDPLVWGLSASLIAGIVVSLLTAPPHPHLVSKLFDAQSAP